MKKNDEVSAVLYDISRLLELEGEEAYRIRAYRKASQSVSSLEGDIEEYYKEGRLRDIPGVGPSIGSVIEELLRTGRSGLLETLKKETPLELYEVIEVPGIGRKTALKVHRALGVATIEEFRDAARSHRIRRIKGLGDKVEKKILDALDRHNKALSETRIPVFRASAIAAEIMGYFKDCEGLAQADVAGSLRRRAPMIGDIDIVAAAHDPAEVIDCFCNMPITRIVKDRGEHHAEITTRYRVDAKLKIVSRDNYGLRLALNTGSKAHLRELEKRAMARGDRLSKEGFYKGGEEKVKFPREEGLYRALGLEYIPPELREGRGEVDAAAKGTLPDLITVEDIRGDLHVHTEWSDGSSSIQDMAMAARAKGYEYVAICDHSKSLHIANGLSIERLRDQMAEIDRLNDTLENFTILKGSEVDIMPDGSLDLPDDVLEDLDIVVGSVHTQLRQDADVVTRRVINALENEHLTILAHPTSRILGRREPTAIDIDRVIEAAKENNKVLEVNAYPDRLDLSDEHVKKAMDAGVMVSIDTDSHGIAELDYMEFGVNNARRGWATKARVLNTLSTGALLEYIERY
ncbi:DNA-directed DNA polymerase X [Methanocella arvoryzae MRE50]|uniref:DNA-directed DNA polymerase n=2 Tax=Methanocella TaxID=570266 RepID=Q0W549_METAR|nr:DNA-directed DNA polymerase X [Methanocella arvoryzae MRE50]